MLTPRGRSRSSVNLSNKQPSKMRSSSNQSSKQDDDEDQEQDSNEVVSSFEPFAVETSIKQHIDDMDDSSYDGPVDLDEIFQVCV